MDTINATVTQDGRWWVADFTVDGHEYGTQARRLGDVAAQVADAAALMTDRDPSDYTVTITAADPRWAALIDDYQRAAADLARAQDAARDASRAAVTALRAQGLTGRDVAALMGISPQRVSQLVA
ncbi:helix-turn-helix domain-containing protein [Actinomyces faecalis]|uniref:helix-turn-helix domain-containing protein n=1 Tax=Actinomyces faecalis TaxID=2722820 RepID=UPI001557C744|nr:helix-turn-helix transcriptional regulator [Actinomyces faecalis]